MGEIEYKRRIYQYTTEEGKRGYICLLDEYLKMESIGHISTNLVEKIVDLATDESYRKTANKITKVTNQSISYSAAWNIIQNLGEQLKQKEKHEIKLNKEEKSQGKKETKILFEEMDGAWINIQGKDKRAKGKEKKDRYVLKNKKAYASFGSSKEFRELRQAKIAKQYNTDEIETKIVNGGN